MKVLFFYIAYPLAMGTYFKRALQRRTDIELKVVGPYSGAYIPWLGGMNLPVKYAKPPDIPLPYPPQSSEVSYGWVKSKLDGWVPDLVLTADAGIRWSSKPTDGVVAHIATDPHVLNYDLPRSYSDVFFNMQKVYSQGNDVWLPYAFDPTVWYPETDNPPVNPVDACMIGMPYPQRIEWVTALQSRGVSVIFENGPIFDEARALYQRAKIGLNWSSLLDLNARVFELMGMALCPVMNRVPDLSELFIEGKEYLGFSTMQEAVEKVLWAKDHPEEAAEIACNAYGEVQKHTYDVRVSQILEECGF